MSTGGLSPAEIEARRRACLASDLMTKHLSWYTWFPFTPPLVNPVATFTPEEDYFLTAVAVNAVASGVGVSTAVLARSPSPTFLGQQVSSGALILQIDIDGGMGTYNQFFNFTPHGFYLERGLTLYLHVQPPAALPMMWGSMNLFLLPMGG